MEYLFLHKKDYVPRYATAQMNFENSVPTETARHSRPHDALSIKCPE